MIFQGKESNYDLMYYRTFLHLADFFHKKKILRFLKNYKKEVKIIYDIGCHDCSYVKIFCNIFNDIKIYAFEANPDLITKAKKNIKDFNNVKLIQMGVGNSNKYENFNINSNNLTSTFQNHNKESIIYKIKNIIGQNINYKKKIKVITLQRFISKNKLPDFIKIDVEGYEYNVLLGLKKNLKNIKILMIEYRHDSLYLNYNNQLIDKLLKKNKFQLVKKIKFPFLPFEDRFYINDNLLKKLDLID
jgi:FkbM family methyltransferase